MNNFDENIEINSIADLYQEYHLSIFRYLYRLTGSSQVAEELTQETFYQVIISVYRFKGLSKVSTWLFKVARNVYLKDKREQIRDDKLENRISVNQLTGSEGKNIGPEQILEQKLLEQRIQDTLNKLKEEHRTVIVLKDIEGLQHSEIAEILGKATATVKVLLHRARQQFRDIYSQIGGE